MPIRLAATIIVAATKGLRGMVLSPNPIFIWKNDNNKNDSNNCLQSR